jgi:hypothetical protein
MRRSFFPVIERFVHAFSVLAFRQLREALDGQIQIFCFKVDPDELSPVHERGQAGRDDISRILSGTPDACLYITRNISFTGKHMDKENTSMGIQGEQLNIPKYNMVYCGIMKATTIKIYEDTKSDLDTFREYKNESYDEVIKKVVYIAKNVKTEPELSIETIEAIEKARERMKKGKFLTEDEARQRLGL